MLPVSTLDQVGAHLMQPNGIDVLLIDVSVTGGLFQTIQTTHRWVAANEYLSIVLMGESKDMDMAVEAVKYAAYSYMPRPCGLKVTIHFLEQAFERSRLMRRGNQAVRELEQMRARIDTLIHALNNKLTTLFTRLELFILHQPTLSGKPVQLFDTLRKNTLAIRDLIQQWPDKAEQPAQPAEVRPGVSQGGAWLGKILMVDDDPDIVMLADALQTQGYQVTTAQNGIQALQELADQTYDLVISDINMPMMNGKLFYQEISVSLPQMKQKMIFITGDHSNRETQAFLEKSHCLWLLKPFNFSDLRLSIQQALGPQAV